MSEVNNTPSSIDDGIPEVTFTLQVSQVVQAPIDDTLTIAGEAADAKATGDAIAQARADLQEEISEISQDIDGIIDALFPVGCIYVSASDTAPTFGGDNWNWQEIIIPVTQGDLMDGIRNYSPVGSVVPGTMHFWLRIADTEVNA